MSTSFTSLTSMVNDLTRLKDAISDIGIHPRESICAKQQCENGIYNLQDNTHPLSQVEILNQVLWAQIIFKLPKQVPACWI
jgi:hypothetical protein